MDTMITCQNDNLCKFLTKEEMRSKAPYLFATAPTSDRVSDKYVFANTETIIDDMAKLGWGVVDCKQQRNNKKKPSQRSFHIVVFQNPNIYITKTDESGEETIDCYPRIIVQNSHDGYNSFKFMCGLFRIVCSNGLIIATETFENISVRHINYTFDYLRQIVADAISAVEENISVMDKMESTTLTAEQKNELALSALRIRKNDDTLKADEETIAEILEPKRDADKGDNLWVVFNIIQEKMVKGDFSLTGKNNKARKARPITGVAKDLDFNQRFFQTAHSYCTRLAA